MSSTTAASTCRPAAVSPPESQESFHQLAARLRAELAPEGAHQAFLVDRMAYARHALVRYERLQAEAMEEILTASDAGDRSPDGRILAVLERRSNILDRIERSIHEAERAYYRAWRQFQAARKAAPAGAAQLASEVETQEPAPAATKKYEQLAAEVSATLNRRPPVLPQPSVVAAMANARQLKADPGSPSLRL